MRTSRVLGFLAMGAVGAAVAAGPPDEGKSVYETVCMTCHGADGRGALPGVPDFTKKDGVLAEPDDVLLKHIIDGFQSPGSAVPMPPKGGDPSLTEGQLRAVIRYLRQQFGGQ